MGGSRASGRPKGLVPVFVVAWSEDGVCRATKEIAAIDEGLPIVAKPIGSNSGLAPAPLPFWIERHPRISKRSLRTRRLSDEGILGGDRRGAYPQEGAEP